MSCSSRAETIEFSINLKFSLHNKAKYATVNANALSEQDKANTVTVAYFLTRFGA